MSKSVKHILAYLFVLALLHLVNRLPRRAALWVGTAVGRLGYRAMRKERRKVEAGLRTALGGEMDEGARRALARQVFVHLARNAVDAMRVRRAFGGEIEAIVGAEGLEHLDRALAQGRGAIALSGHIGSWELLGAYLVRRGYPVSVVGRPLRDPRFHRLLIAHRKSADIQNLIREGRGSLIPAILRALRMNRVVGLLADQNTDVDGLFVVFFGRPAYTPVGPVVLSLRTGAPILPMAIHRQADETHRVVVRPPLALVATGDRDADLRENVQRCAAAIEALIREHPSQWVWMHRRWDVSRQ